MRHVFGWFLAPIAVAALGWLGGSLFGNAGTWLTAGFVAAAALATLLAIASRRALRRITMFASWDENEARSGAATMPAPGEFGHAVRAVAAFAQDAINTRRQDTAQLARQSAVIDRMNDGLLLANASGRVVWANVAAGSLFRGRNPTGRSFISVTRDHELNAALQRCLATGNDQHHTFEIPGEGRLASAVFTRVGHRPPEALIMVRDITEVSRLQHLRRDFVANVSHELRTPLSTIKILTETILDLREDDEEASTYLRKIDNEVDSMAALVRDLLDLTRLEAQGAHLTLKSLDAAALTRDVFERMQPLAARQNVTLNIVASNDIGKIEGDERRLHQALINLLTNAIAHTPAGGEVTIETLRDASAVTFIVRDTGRGIPAEDLPRIWERFFKTDRARTGPGTGLGLAIVKHIVQAHNGTVSATSQVGKGSEFRVLIPRGQRAMGTPDRASDRAFTWG